MELILDTNALSAVAEGEAEAVRFFQDADSVALPVIVLGEYRFGIAQSRFRDDYETWLSEMITACRVLEIVDSTTAHYASIRSELKRAGSPLPSNDVWIAALCREYRSPLLSDDRHFDAVRGLHRIAWRE